MGNIEEEYDELLQQSVEGLNCPFCGFQIQRVDDIWVYCKVCNKKMFHFEVLKYGKSGDSYWNKNELLHKKINKEFHDAYKPIIQKDALPFLQKIDKIIKGGIKVVNKKDLKENFLLTDKEIKKLKLMGIVKFE